MKEALREGLESFTPPPILLHVNGDTVPPTVTLGITACEFMGISAAISAVLRGETDRTVPVSTGHMPAMQMFLSPDPVRTKTSSKDRL
eukprot:4851113-Prorocentrum_lima.AAC.1